MLRRWWFMLASKAAWKRAEISANAAIMFRDGSFDQSRMAEWTEKMKGHIADAIRLAEIAHGKRRIGS